MLKAPHILAFRDGHMIGGDGHEVYVRNLNAPVNQRFAVMHVGEPIVDPRPTTWSATRPPTRRPPS